MATNPHQEAVVSNVNSVFEVKSHKRTGTVDIPAPTVWLHHDANAALRLRRNAQANLELRLSSGHPRRLKCSMVNQRIRDGMHGMADYNNKVTISRPLAKIFRTVYEGGDVLPWGLWPVRLRNLEGESFYGDSNDVTQHPVPYWAGGSVVGGNSDVAGVDAVNEHSIHDELVWRRLQLPLSSAVSRGGPDLSGGARDGYHRHDGIVRRLLPSKRGQWIDTTLESPSMTASVPQPPLDASGPYADADEVDDYENTCSRPTTVATAASRPAGSAIIMDATNRKRSAAQEGESENKRRRSAAATAEVMIELDPPTSEDEDGETSFSGDERVEGLSDERAHGADRVKDGIYRAQGMCGSKGEGCAGDGVGEVRRRGDNDRRQGWTVAEPAKETVGRVWARARRRSLDVFHPNFSTRTRASVKVASDGAAGKKGEEVTEKHEAVSDGEGRCGSDDGATTGWDDYSVNSQFREKNDGGQQGASACLDAKVPATTECAMEGILDPKLMSLLSRELEGIIDSALHVVLSHQLDRSRSGPAKSAAADETHAAADWQDMLRTFWRCSTAARKVASKDWSNLPDGAGGARLREVWGLGESSDGAVVVVDERLPALPLNEAVVTRAYNRMLLYLLEKKPWQR